MKQHVTYIHKLLTTTTRNTQEDWQREGMMFMPETEWRRVAEMRNVAEIQVSSAKRARGLMARFVIENRIEDPKRLEEFAVEGYSFRSDLSDPGRPTFVRKQEWAAA